MDTTELHYLNYDPDTIMEAMLTAYAEAGGDILYPGDEKSMLLSAVQAVIMQAFAGVDAALRMGTLRYAEGEYLDVIGETRMCERFEATNAKATIAIKTVAGMGSATIDEGQAVTKDGTMIYTLDHDVDIIGNGETLTADITCTTAGADGNILEAGDALQFMIPNAYVESVTVTKEAAGGADRETDDKYRERIRTYGASIVTTGPAMMYEAKAKAVSNQIIDAKAVQRNLNEVHIILLISDDADKPTILKAVKDKLSDKSERPMTDLVYTENAGKVNYTLNVEYYGEYGVDISEAVERSIAEYQDWQDKTIGQAFNPDRLMALLYRNGATRVLWGDGSNFNGSTVAYTEIADNKVCKGTITVRRM